MRPTACFMDGSRLAECPLWDWRRQRLLYLDLLDPWLIEYDPAARRVTRRRLALQPPLGGLCLRERGGYLVLDAQGVHAVSDRLDLMELVVAPHPSFQQAPPNDAIPCPDGSLLVATAHRAETEPVGGLYRLDFDLHWHALADGITVGNGPTFDAAGSTLYFADSPAGAIYACAWDAARGSLAQRRLFATSAGGDLPDGMTLDATGCLWSARWGGGKVLRYHSDGTLLQNLVVPERYVTSCVFGGSRLDTLFITTAHPAVVERRVQASSTLATARLYAVPAPVAGLPALACAI